MEYIILSVIGMVCGIVACGIGIGSLVKREHIRLTAILAVFGFFMALYHLLTMVNYMYPKINMFVIAPVSKGVSV